MKHKCLFPIIIFDFSASILFEVLKSLQKLKSLRIFRVFALLKHAKASLVPKPTVSFLKGLAVIFTSPDQAVRVGVRECTF